MTLVAPIRPEEPYKLTNLLRSLRETGRQPTESEAATLATQKRQVAAMNKWRRDYKLYVVAANAAFLERKTSESEELHHDAILDQQDGEEYE